MKIKTTIIFNLSEENLSIWATQNGWNGEGSLDSWVERYLEDKSVQQIKDLIIPPLNIYYGIAGENKVKEITLDLSPEANTTIEI